MTAYPETESQDACVYPTEPYGPEVKHSAFGLDDELKIEHDQQPGNSITRIAQAISTIPNQGDNAQDREPTEPLT